MQRHLLLLDLLFFGLSVVSQSATAQSACLPADSISTARLQWLDSLATRVDSEYVANRQWLNIPKTTSAQVTPITTTNTCASARTAVNTIAGTPGRVARVYLYKLGTRYAVEDPSLLGVQGDYRPVHFSSFAFSYLSFAALTR